jgi:hypothetical protein
MGSQTMYVCNLIYSRYLKVKVYRTPLWKVLFHKLIWPYLYFVISSGCFLNAVWKLEDLNQIINRELFCSSLQQPNFSSSWTSVCKSYVTFKNRSQLYTQSSFLFIAKPYITYILLHLFFSTRMYVHGKDFRSLNTWVDISRIINCET